MSSDAEALLALSTAPIDIEGRMPNSSNATFLVQVGDPEAGIKGIYKPLRGERPLWDFPAGLYKREVAAYLLSESLGYHLVPPTVMRDGPLGEGSLQLFINYDPDEHYFIIYEQRPELQERVSNGLSGEIPNDCAQFEIITKAHSVVDAPYCSVVIEKNMTTFAVSVVHHHI